MKRERESVESQAPHCPTCERPFEGINDYPKIVIRDLTISAIPKVRDAMRHDDDLALVKEVSKNPKVKDYLMELTAAKGQLIKLGDIKPDLPQYEDGEGKRLDYFKLHKAFYLHVDDSKTPGLARVLISKHINAGNLGWGFLEVAELAKIKYEGVLNGSNFQGD